MSALNERLVLAGSLELIPIDESFPIMYWQTIRKPAEVLRKIQAAIGRSRQNGSPLAGRCRVAHARRGLTCAWLVPQMVEQHAVDGKARGQPRMSRPRSASLAADQYD